MSRALCRYSKRLCRSFQLSNLCRQIHCTPNLCQTRLISSHINAAELRFGQPLHETHPHLLQAGEVTPGITALEYAQRRTKLAAQLPANAIAVVAASDVVFRTGHVFYNFHQDPDFFYLTGFNEPEALAVIGKASSNDDHIFYLYVREKDPKAEIWDGARSGTQAALDVFNADETGDISNLKRFLTPLVEEASHIYTDITSLPTTTSTFLEFLRGPCKPSPGFSELISTKKTKPLRPLLNDLRIQKSPSEIHNMRKAGQASGRAFTSAMRHHFTRESHLDAFLAYQFRMNGCDRSAFEPVAAGGPNALSIHYVRNDSLLHAGDLVLADAGGEYAGYVSDITRTWPVDGKFTPLQRDLYDAVLTVQRSCIRECRADTHTSLELLHQKAERELKDALRQIGFDMSGNAINVLFPHHLSHYLGLDLHDCIGYSKKAKLKAGHCLTVEPGVYVPSGDERFPRRFWGMGVRIEDSVCVLDGDGDADAGNGEGNVGPLVLTAEAVKEVEDIEALR
ncbi:hypothetical protein GJ744_005089 [Endocarpon pusillum]|uniref:Xaa-Pro aminopeptidase n=1 Tax=Endocarpon pusillum TaxID=364733 RepID=A0A8H7AQN1_9EURO|nr:hypothetical protein GJ744_005089 [Endocarpon pusillum]